MCKAINKLGRQLVEVNSNPHSPQRVYDIMGYQTHPVMVLVEPDIDHLSILLRLLIQGHSKCLEPVDIEKTIIDSLWLELKGVLLDWTHLRRLDSRVVCLLNM